MALGGDPTQRPSLVWEIAGFLMVLGCALVVGTFHDWGSRGLGSWWTLAHVCSYFSGIGWGVTGTMEALRHLEMLYQDWRSRPLKWNGRRFDAKVEPVSSSRRKRGKLSHARDRPT